MQTVQLPECRMSKDDWGPPYLVLKTDAFQTNQRHFMEMVILANRIIDAISACEDGHVRLQLQRLYDSVMAQSQFVAQQNKKLAEEPTYKLHSV